MSAEELLDVVDADGRVVGAPKSRAAVHRDGDWHLAFHLWVAGPDGVLLQRRARTKAGWPGGLDATAAGHLLAGETIADGLREADEELGVRFAFDALVTLGVHRVEDPDGEGAINRELQHVFAVRDERPLSAWRDFDRRELGGLVLVGHEAFAALVGGAPAPGREWDGVVERPVSLHPGELVPAPYLPALAPRLAEL
jgi:isopentenyldiphosphate isomerase